MYAHGFDDLDGHGWAWAICEVLRLDAHAAVFAVPLHCGACAKPHPQPRDLSVLDLKTNVGRERDQDD